MVIMPTPFAPGVMRCYLHVEYYFHLNFIPNVFQSKTKGSSILKLSFLVPFSLEF